MIFASLKIDELMKLMQ